jgi:hypothetical protein
VTRSHLHGLVRVFIGVALVGSVAWQVIDRVANDLFRPTEYFAFFSIVSAIVAGIIFVLSGVERLRGRPESARHTILLLTAAASMTVVGVVYHALLANAAADPRDLGYAWPSLPNEIIHTWAPILIALGFVFSTRAKALRLRQAFWVAVFPLAWLGFSVVRGLADDWWPYWFIDPSGEGGVVGMIVYVVAIAVFFVTLGFVFIALNLVVRRIVGERSAMFV